MRQLPFLKWLPEYRNTGTIRADLLAGLTGAIVVLPKELHLHCSLECRRITAFMPPWCLA